MFEIFIGSAQSFLGGLDWTEDFASFGLILLAGLLGGIVGIEREVKRKPAGLRTHIFVAASACLLMVVGQSMIDIYSALETPNTVAADPTRILHAIVIGISFLGAGTIMKQGEQIEGLTTSASVLLVTGIGIAVALQQFVLATLLSVTAAITLHLLGLIERGFSKRS